MTLSKPFVVPTGEFAANLESTSVVAGCSYRSSAPECSSHQQLSYQVRSRCTSRCQQSPVKIILSVTSNLVLITFQPNFNNSLVAPAVQALNLLHCHFGVAWLAFRRTHLATDSVRYYREAQEHSDVCVLVNHIGGDNSTANDHPRLVLLRQDGDGSRQHRFVQRVQERRWTQLVRH